MKQASVFYLFVLIFLILLCLFLKSFYFEFKNKHYERFFHASMEAVAIKRPETFEKAQEEWLQLQKGHRQKSEVKYYQAYPLIFRVRTCYEGRYVFEKTLIEEVKYGKD